MSTGSSLHGIMCSEYSQWILNACIPCDSFPVTSLNWQNYGEAKKISGCQELRTKGEKDMAVKKNPHVNGIVLYLDSSGGVNLNTCDKFALNKCMHKHMYTYKWVRANLTKSE